MGGLLATVSLTTALTGHAVGAPIIFAAVTAHLFLRSGGRPPIVVAGTFTAIVVALDALIVAWLIQRSFAMFSSVLGTWLPFALIFVSVFVTGALLWRGPFVFAANACNRLRRTHRRIGTKSGGEL
jgi:hypothetical protein